MTTENCNDIEIALRVLNAYTGHNLPLTSDEAYLRVLTGDGSTPSDELACRVVQAELQRLRFDCSAPDRLDSTEGVKLLPGGRLTKGRSDEARYPWLASGSKGGREPQHS